MSTSPSLLRTCPSNALFPQDAPSRSCIWGTRPSFRFCRSRFSWFSASVRAATCSYAWAYEVDTTIVHAVSPRSISTSPILQCRKRTMRVLRRNDSTDSSIVGTALRQHAQLRLRHALRTRVDQTLLAYARRWAIMCAWVSTHLCGRDSRIVTRWVDLLMTRVQHRYSL